MQKEDSRYTELVSGEINFCRGSMSMRYKVKETKCKANIKISNISKIQTPFDGG
ncbi:hypothetical protein AsFPU1_1792 [Aphanothece sacrum FPU1]|uniref:Uncharacterized protein n=1 Tax=Aphanothece sacrum FPU1 TaxID=1920663 RepID=A0A401IGP1_APHSA|nr:hypothetical protein AsFPU1_1792 [Aphanothece sacrum FPU1]GBF84902.1 hypothetical protein AsFPU3_1957 [Aphanothece sacrum FPU3]